MSDLKLFRCRAGFYVTKDAQWRIVRRQWLIRSIRYWHVEQWHAGERNYLPIGRFSTLAQAREQLARAIRPIVDEA